MKTKTLARHVFHPLLAAAILLTAGSVFAQGEKKGPITEDLSALGVAVDGRNPAGNISKSDTIPSSKKGVTEKGLSNKNDIENKAEGTPIGGIIVKGGRNPAGNGSKTDTTPSSKKGISQAGLGNKNDVENTDAQTVNGSKSNVKNN